ncbi:MAG: hypothetical protein R3C56_42830 [Pirellulaceae bacterium]
MRFLFTASAITLLMASIVSTTASQAVEPFKIRVVDDVSGRGVPLVELTTVNNVRFVTDSAGLVAFDDAALMDQPVFFHVKSHGYEYPADKFGYHGRTIKIVAGGEATLKLKRINIAERMYRMTIRVCRLAMSPCRQNRLRP